MAISFRSASVIASGGGRHDGVGRGGTVTPNDLRRSHAQHCRQAGYRLEHVSASLGHTDTTMVARVYGRLSGSNLAVAIRATLPTSSV